MIFVGTDIVSISRMDKLIRDKGDKFLDHIFTIKEKDYCNKKSLPSVHYSGKFAAKEAVKKSILSSKSVLTITLKSIEIQNALCGMPFVQIKDSDIDTDNLKVSISHTESYATATAILVTK